MNIVHVIQTKFPVSGYGGTERVAYWLGKGQAELGHKVTYICLPGSYLPFAETRELPQHWDDLTPYIPPGTDIVQLYGTPNYRLDFPYLVNIGGNGRPGEVFHPNTVFVSRNHAERHGWKEYVHNGIEIGEYPLERQKENFALFLAKVKWRVKNIKGAVRIAQSTKVPLWIAGGKVGFWVRGTRSFGTIDGSKKLELLQRARALLFPVIWNEPFGLAVVEALACGTPVVATPWGSLPEIVDSSCGILADSFTGLCNGLIEATKFSPEACRARVESNFTHIHMANSYLRYYTLVLKHGTIAQGQPQVPMDLDPGAKVFYKGYN